MNNLLKHKLNKKLLIEKITNLYKGSSLKKRAAKGGIWLGAGSGTENGLRLLRNMILARLLAPDAFGLMAIVLAVNVFFDSFTKIGVKEAIIQNPKGNENTFLNGAFWLAFVRGIVMFIAAIIMVPLVARFYNKPELVPMMRVVFLSILFYGMMSPKSYTELKQMNYKKWVIIFHGGSVIGVITTIIMGFILHNIWALVIGFTVESAARCIVSYIICPFLPGFNFEKENLRSLFRFARGIFGISIVVFLYNRIDIFVLGKFVADSELGMYSLAFGLAQTPYLLFCAIINPIIFPVFSSLQHDRFLLVRSVLKTSQYIAIVFLPLLTLMACVSSQLLLFMYGKIYASVSLTFIIFCASLAVWIVGTTIVNALYAIGQPQLTRTASLVRLIVMLIIIVPFVKRFGLNGAAVASLFSGFAWICFILLQLKRKIGLSIEKYINSLTAGIIISIFLVIIFYLIK